MTRRRAPVHHRPQAWEPCPISEPRRTWDHADMDRARMAQMRHNMMSGCNYSKYSTPAMMDAMPEKAVKVLGLAPDSAQKRG